MPFAIVPAFAVSVNPVKGTLLLAGSTTRIQGGTAGPGAPVRNEIIEIAGLPAIGATQVVPAPGGPTTPGGSSENLAPSATFAAAPTSSASAFDVTFDASASSDADGTIVEYQWDFGDGSTGTGQSVNHVYGALGTFSVTLTVADNSGAIGVATQTYVIGSALNMPPVSAFSVSNAGGLAPLTVTFDGSGASDTDGTIIDYSWSIGDTQIGTGAAITHTFSSPGLYNVNLTVTDNHGSATTVSHGVAIFPPSSRQVPLTKLPGLIGGTPARTTVYMADLSNLGLTNIGSVAILDNSAGSGGASGQFSGIDLDALRLSTISCSDASCVANLSAPPILNISPGRVVFAPGSQRPPADPKLFGTDLTGAAVDFATASLSSFDANAGPSNPDKRGSLSLGDGGILIASLQNPISTSGLNLYIGEVGDAEMSTASVIISDAALPVSDQLAAAIDAARIAIANNATLIDLDGDGFTEYQRILDSAQNMIREEFDLNRDGTPEIVWDRQDPKKTFTVDADGDGTPEIKREMNPNPAPGDAIATLTRDTDADGVPDYRYSYSVDTASGEILIQHETDRDQDGQYTAAGTSRTSQTQNQVVFHGTSCSPSQQQQIQLAYREAITRGGDCLFGLDPYLFALFGSFVASTDIAVSCGACPGGGSGCVTEQDVRAYWEGGQSEVDIKIAQFGGVSDVAATIFHETMHYIQGLHLHGDGTDDPGDATYACEKTCFGSGTSQTCAACLGVPNGDRRCDKYPFEVCQGEAHQCKCDGKIYPTQGSCAGQCNLNLGCFSNQCQRIARGPCQY